jgi:hypothetical protein
LLLCRAVTRGTHGFSGLALLDGKEAEQFCRLTLTVY